MATVTFHGHACFEITNGDSRILIDPFLTGNPLADVGPDSFENLDAILLSHGHGDHLGDTVQIAKRTGALVVAQYELAGYLNSCGVSNTHPMHIGGGHDFPFGHVKMVVAFHGGMVEGEGGERFTTFPCGYVINTGGTRIYHAGDTALTLEMKLLEGRVDVMLVPIGDNFTMGIEDAARAVEFVKPRVVIPMHFNTFEIVNQDPQEFVKAVGTGSTVNLLTPGESFET